MSPRDEHQPHISWDEMIVNYAKRVAPARIEPSAEMREAARNLMELYTAVRDTGFDDEHAMTIVLATIQAGRRSSGE